MLCFSQYCTDFVRRPGETLRHLWPGYRSMPALVPMVLVGIFLYGVCVHEQLYQGFKAPWIQFSCI